MILRDKAPHSAATPALLILIFALMLLIPLLCLKPGQLPFDAELSGVYELSGTAEAPEYLNILDNGRFINSNGSGWVELYAPNIIKFVYDDGSVQESGYTRQGQYLTLDSGCKYIDSAALTPAGGIAPGTYIDSAATVLFEFDGEGLGRILSFDGSKQLVFKYSFADSLLRMEYGSGQSVSYEYINFEVSDGHILLNPGSESQMELVCESGSAPPDGGYIPVFKSPADNDTAIRSISFNDGTAIMNGMEYNTYFFDDGTVIFENGGVLSPFNISVDGNSLVLSREGVSLEFVSDSSFQDNAGSGLAGVYASSDLSTILTINADGTGNYTRDGLGFDFTCTVSGSILRCRDKVSGQIIYLEFKQTAEGLGIAELPRAKDDDSGFTGLVKIK